MDKSKLLIIFKIENFCIGIAITIVVILLMITTTEGYTMWLGLGMLTGAWLGVGLNHFIKIPKVFGNKDERQLMITIIAGSLSITFGFVAFLLLFMLNSLGISNITRDTMTLTIIGVGTIMIVVRIVTYKLMDNIL